MIEEAEQVVITLNGIVVNLVTDSIVIDICDKCDKEDWYFKYFDKITFCTKERFDKNYRGYFDNIILSVRVKEGRVFNFTGQIKEEEITFYLADVEYTYNFYGKRI